MHESADNYHNLEWPKEGDRLAGPIVWLRGWVVGKPGHNCIDVRVRHNGGTHLGVLGLPRVDLATHFGSSRAWLPAEFIIGVPVNDGPVSLGLEVMDAHGGWQELRQVSLTIAPDGTPPPRVEGRLESRENDTWTVRDAHHPFHGHLDDPGATPVIRHGRIPVFGWLLDETRPIATVLATTDTLVYNHLAHSLSDDALAAKVPQHAAARHARLRGHVDFPATLVHPACLRVYGVSPDGAVQLCFAQRINPTPGGTRPPNGFENHAANPDRPEAGLHPFPTITLRPLPDLPSGRPRRLLLVVRSLQPNDASLRALDLARHLIPSHRWAARLISAEDGPLRHDFALCDVGILEINPARFFAAGNAVAMEKALQDLQRAIRWDHLDAVVVFDAVCGWAITLAGRRNIPVLFDCLDTEPLAPDPTSIPEVQALLRDSWRAATVRCFGSAAAAQAQFQALGDLPAEIIPQWHTPGLTTAPATGDRRTALAPLRTVDWLTRCHPVTAARWDFRQGPAGLIDEERLVRQDDAANSPILQHGADWSVPGLDLCLGPLFGRGPLRPVIDAAATGIPVVAPRLAITEELFAGARVQLVDEANPLALAQALLAWENLPDTFQREASALAPEFQARHDPARLRPRWERLLAAVAAKGGNPRNSSGA